MEINEQPVAVQGENLMVRMIGDITEQPVVIFLHEALGSIGQWKDFPEAFSNATGLSCLVYDRAGYGRSTGSIYPRENDFLNNKSPKELKALIDVLLPDQQVILFGHSDGASIALAFASLFPDSTLGVISEAAHIFVEPETLEGVRAAKPIYDRGMRKPLMKYQGDRVDDIFFGWWDTWQTPEFVQWNMEYMLPDIKAPVFAIQGSEDEYGTDKQVQHIVDQVSGFSEAWIIPGCRHMPHKERREEVIDRCNTFIQQHVIRSLEQA